MSLLLPSEIAKLAEAGGKTHAEAMKILKKENPDWPEGDLADAANSVSPSMGADARKVQKRYQALTKSASTESPMMLPSELARLGKFPAGVSMTIDEVAAVVGDEFKQMNENPPPEVVALREEMMDKAAAKRKMPAADMALVVQGKFPNAYVTLSGLFGDGADDISEVIGSMSEFKGGRSNVSDADEAKALMEKAQKEFSKNKSFKVSLSKDILDLPQLSIKWAGKTARFEEGPAGAKAFDAWMAKQPKEVQDDWAKYTEENGDKFKTAADAKRKPDLEAVKKLEGVVSVKMTPKREIVVVVENDIGNMASKYLTDKIAMILDQWDVDDSGFYRSSEDIPKGKKNQFTYTLKSGIGSKTAGRFPPPDDEGWDRLGFELLEQDDDMQQYWWKKGKLYFVNLDAYEEDIYEYSEQVDLAAAKAIARKGQGKRDEAFQRLASVKTAASHDCPVCGADEADEDKSGWGLPYMCGTCYSHLSDLENDGKDVEKILKKDKVLPFKKAADSYKVGDKVRLDFFGSDKSEPGKVKEIDDKGQPTKFVDKGGTILGVKDVVHFKKAAAPVMARASDLVGDLNGEWDKVVRAFRGTPKSSEVARIAQVIEDLEMAIMKLSPFALKLARYEEGQPADPTAEMSPEDAKKWEGNTEKYKDKFTDEESMMDKFQEQLLPSESFALMAATRFRHRSTWKSAEVEDDIGKKVKGPEESDKDEPYMKGQFTQVENSELSGKVAAEAYAEGSRVKQDGGKEGTVTKAKMVEGKQMYEVKWDGASISVDRKHADLKPVKTAGQKIYGHLVWLE